MPWAVAAAAVVVGGSMVSANQKKQAAKGAANAQQQGAANATAEQQQEFNTVQQLYSPTRNLGYGATSLLASLFGIPDPNKTALQAGNWTPINPTASAAAAPPVDPNAPPVYSATDNNLRSGMEAASSIGGGGFANFLNSPGYQFTLHQGEQAINRGASARGDLYTTNNLAQLNDYSQGMASTHYNDYVNQLLSMAGLGSAATAGTANAAITTGNNISANDLSGGNAEASGLLAQGGANASAVTSSANAIGGMFKGPGG